MEKESVNYAIPGAIIIAGIIIAGAVVYTNGGGNFAQSDEGGGSVQTESIENFRPVSEEDHVRGNPDASITIVEFSDFECPFCAQYHPTLSRLVEEYDDVNWVYRHFPLTSIHSRAQSAAVASECTAKLGGNDAFWAFSDALFENQSRLGDELYGETAALLGIDGGAFGECLVSEEALASVEADLEEAIRSGGGGTPFSVIIMPDGQFFSFSGALRYEQVEQIVSQIREGV